MNLHKVEFPDSPFEPVELPEGSCLPDYLTPDNSPVFFGCRSGVCATCLIEVEPVNGEIPSPKEEELETLEIYAEGNPKARLACQLCLTADIKVKKIDPI